MSSQLPLWGGVADLGDTVQLPAGHHVVAGVCSWRTAGTDTVGGFWQVRPRCDRNVRRNPWSRAGSRASGNKVRLLLRRVNNKCADRFRVV